jgi:hypothetical protein
MGTSYTEMMASNGNSIYQDTVVDDGKVEECNKYITNYLNMRKDNPVFVINNLCQGSASRPNS